MTKKVFLSLILVLITVLACNTNNTDSTPAIDPDTGKSYFFLVEGKYREYEVFEIRYFGVDISDTFRFELREEVSGAFESPGGEVSNLIHRFRRGDDTEPWRLDSVWSARADLDKAVSVENNKPIVKMVFPVITGRIWDGNLFNTGGQDTFEIKTFNQNFNVPNSLTSFTEAMVIEQHNEQDDNNGEFEFPVTFRDIRREVYADSIGLVFKEYNVVQFCTVGACLRQGIIQTGRFYREILIAHGTIGEEGG